MKSDNHPRLFCDVMLGRLARRLRLLGLDVRYEPGVRGLQAYRRAKADRRLFLTRHQKLKGLPDVLLLESENTDRQLEEVREVLGIPQEKPRSESQARSRCPVCNEVLKKISRDQARPAVPFYIYQIHNDFRRCPQCQRVFWPGSHVQKMFKQGGK